MTKKEFALSRIAPYMADWTLCAVEVESQPLIKKDGPFVATLKCKYLAKDGRKCVAGSCMNDDVLTWVGDTAIQQLISGYGQDMIFKPEHANILDEDEWGLLQRLHDTIASPADRESVKYVIEGFTANRALSNQTSLFTYKELVEAADKLLKTI